MWRLVCCFGRLLCLRSGASYVADQLPAHFLAQAFQKQLGSRGEGAVAFRGDARVQREGRLNRAERKAARVSRIHKAVDAKRVAQPSLYKKRCVREQLQVATI